MNLITEKTIQFIKERETKNTIRYKENSSMREAIIGTIYLQKSFLPHKPPENIKITVQFDSQS